MEVFDFSSIVYLILMGLIVLSVASFIFIIRSLYINSSAKSKRNDEIDKKLDKIISLLEKDRNS
ncbi:DUF4083 domain-containing protein [Sutcliffiella horikoshii]|uniref:DUF4083 domain-containing protein n=1 Tax=Sutcliffiella horikoshii TaxID=79883 RepID=UPI0022AAF2D4|nr:DUF4083 domain-containing protein [Sutcliffiella horikoshii]MCG1023441.1 DUF4083 domain-containing protein [Sutcliffiella horikoshii]